MSLVSPWVCIEIVSSKLGELEKYLKVAREAAEEVLHESEAPNENHKSLSEEEHTMLTRFISNFLQRVTNLL